MGVDDEARRGAARAGGRPTLCQVLRWGVLSGIALLLLTPFVVTPGTLFPFVVGKALWSRSIIEIVFALWAALALTQPAYRPPRSRLLIVLAAGLVVSLLAAGFGVSVQRSLWSTYERMLGVVDLAHWFALAVVLASMFRSASEWRTLLTLNLWVSLAMICLVIARYYQLDVPFYNALPERDFPRVGGPFGNPIYLANYLGVNLLVALGFLARSCLPAAAPAPAQRRRAHSRWPGRVFWAAAAALHLWVFGMAGSTGGAVGLFAGVGFLALAYTFLGRRRERWTAMALTIALGAAAVSLGIRFLGPDPEAPWFNRPPPQLIAKFHLQYPTVQSRFSTWETGLRGFAERPLLGWGPSNFETVFGRFAAGHSSTTEPHDHAHNQFVEVAATTGAAGLAAYLALWVLTFAVVLRAARRLDRQDQALVLFAGAALACGLVQTQFLFYTASGLLQTILLLSFAVSLETAAFPGARHPRLPARLSAAWAALLNRRSVCIALVTAAAALSAAGLTVHQNIYAAADIRYMNTQPSPSTFLAGGIDGFKPLANTYRWHLFNELARNWPTMRAEAGVRARHLLEWAEQESEEVVRTEPQNWRIHQSLARMYRAAAETDPEYEAAARHYLERAQALAPNREVVFPAP